MDDLEYRRRLFANPHDREPDFLAAKKDSSSNQSLTGELEHLDSLIDQALRVDVPEELVDKILFKQTSAACREHRKSRFHFAMAASFVFALGVMIGLINNVVLPVADPITNMAQVALKHYYSEAPFAHKQNENASLQQVNVKLAAFDNILKDVLPGEITYINFCGFNDKRAVHIVLKSDTDKYVNIFVVPQSSSDMVRYSDGNMEAISLPAANKNTLIVVGEQNVDLLPLAERLNQNLDQRI